MKTSNAVLKSCIQAYLNVKDADKAVEFYKKAFGAKEKGRITVNAKIGHAELQIGDCSFMIAEEMKEWGNVSPSTLGGTPLGLCLYVEDVDAVYKNAIAAGGKTEGTMGVKDQFYGDRSGNLIDPFGHKWIISTHIEDVSWEELQKRSDEMMKKNNKTDTSL